MTKNNNLLVISALVVSIFLSSTSLVYSQELDVLAKVAPPDRDIIRNKVMDRIKERKEMRMESSKEKLMDTKLKSCEARSSAIKTRSASLVKMTNNMLTKFDAISTKAQTFYTSKVVPAGGKVDNYDTLLSDIQSEKTKVQEALATAEAGMGEFSCTDDNPKAQMIAFKEDMTAVKTSLKAYRTSIKNLIQAVHKAAEGLVEAETVETTKTGKEEN